jgi:hypothetical protein
MVWIRKENNAGFVHLVAGPAGGVLRLKRVNIRDGSGFGLLKVIRRGNWQIRVIIA